MYNYSILQQVKESLYYYNEKQIADDIKNYLFAINFETGSEVKCKFTGERLEISDNFLERIERYLLGSGFDKRSHEKFRRETQKEYTAHTLTQEIMLMSKNIEETNLFKNLWNHYIHNLKEKVLDPFLENEIFRMAIKDFETEAFKTYDKKIQDDVEFLISNLNSKYNYTQQGAKEACIYVIDNNIASIFAKK
jgi:hypothetical protein